jgi:hypothetical protein
MPSRAARQRPLIRAIPPPREWPSPEGEQRALRRRYPDHSCPGCSRPGAGNCRS